MTILSLYGFLESSNRFYIIGEVYIFIFSSFAEFYLYLEMF